MVYRFAFPLVNWLIRCLAQVTVIGADRMPYGGLLLVSNHLTNADPFIVGMCFKRELHFMGKAELFENPILAWLYRQLNAFPVRRGEVDRAALRYAEALLTSGRVVAIFPEGHRSRAGGVQEAQGGIALLARRAAVPILPVAITGTQHLRLSALRYWRPWRRPTITISVGQPFTLPTTPGRADYNALAATIMEQVVALLPPSYHGVYHLPE